MQKSCYDAALFQFSKRAATFDVYQYVASKTQEKSLRRRGGAKLGENEVFLIPYRKSSCVANKPERKDTHTSRKLAEAAAISAMGLGMAVQNP